MDSSDPFIAFDDNGVCNHCHYFDDCIIPKWPFQNSKVDDFDQVVSDIKRRKPRGSLYDCIVGLSGGVDSSYLVYKLKGKNINPLILHVDGGWNSKLAIQNINLIVAYTGFDLQTLVVDWDAMRVIQLAFLKSGIANQDVPQDHAFIAGLHEVANKYNINTILSGSNYATESILPTLWGYDASDRDHLKSICLKYGGRRAYRKIPTIKFLDQVFINPAIRNIKVISPLNNCFYSKASAIKDLESIGWKYYGGKHYESRWTHFFQSYYLPVKHGYDKRLAHLSSMILSGEISRDAALEKMQIPPYSIDEIKKDIHFISNKLRISQEGFVDIAQNATITVYQDHGNWEQRKKIFYYKYIPLLVASRAFFRSLFS